MQPSINNLNLGLFEEFTGRNEADHSIQKPVTATLALPVALRY